MCVLPQNSLFKEDPKANRVYHRFPWISYSDGRRLLLKFVKLQLGISMQFD